MKEEFELKKRKILEKAQAKLYSLKPIIEENEEKIEKYKELINEQELKNREQEERIQELEAKIRESTLEGPSKQHIIEEGQVQEEEDKIKRKRGRKLFKKDER